MFISPMLLNKSNLPLDNHIDTHITELKLDGIRLILSKFNNKIRLYTRHNNEVTNKFPSLLKIDIPDGTVLDGEIIVPGEDGKPDFEAMMERFMSNRTSHAIQYAVFDIIYCKGEKVTHLPLYERKKLLETTVTPNNEVVLVQWMYGNAKSYFELTKELGLEGIVMKKADSIYQIDKRSDNWLKVINYQYADVVIKGLRKKEFGLLIQEESSAATGVMEFMDPSAKKLFYSQYKNLIIEENKDFVFLKPEIRCRVKFRNYTKKGKLRIPSFVEYIA